VGEHGSDFTGEGADLVADRADRLLEEARIGFQRRSERLGLRVGFAEGGLCIRGHADAGHAGGGGAKKENAAGVDGHGELRSKGGSEQRCIPLRACWLDSYA